MREGFEEKFMEIQSGLISLCLELTHGDVDKIYAYASIEDKSRMFNAFVEKNGEILTLNKLNIDRMLVRQFLKIGTSDLEKLYDLCKQFETQRPTEMKMYYDVKTGKYNADYKYEEVCTANTQYSSGEVFMKWIEEVQNKPR